MGFTELAIVVVVLIILFFGGKKISELSRSAGRAVTEFKKGKIEAEKELKEMIDEDKKGEAKK
jgi:sec-independent protein translocase protein TatA